jgi:Na+/glutamate symporter
MLWGTVGNANTLGGGWGGSAVATTAQPLLTEASTLSVGSAAATFGLQFECLVTNGGTAGTLQFQWSQDTAAVANTTVKAGSLMVIEKLA